MLAQQPEQLLLRLSDSPSSLLGGTERWSEREGEEARGGEETHSWLSCGCERACGECGGERERAACECVGAAVGVVVGERVHVGVGVPSS